jgi:hypothetical protein
MEKVHFFLDSFLQCSPVHSPTHTSDKYPKLREIGIELKENEATVAPDRRGVSPSFQICGPIWDPSRKGDIPYLAIPTPP